jgi:TetR/AcrR family transcriptional regulator, regulator of biofilm formation and stress response
VQTRSSAAQPARRPRGPNDPTRRERIGRAALRVIGERGVEGLTHRSVAEAADVALGSTTYYFRTLDDILEAATEHAATANRLMIEDWASGLPDDPDLANELAALLVRLIVDENERTRIEYELYVAAIRRPALRSLTRPWANTLIDVVTRWLPQDEAATLSATFDGLLLREMVLGSTPSKAELARHLARVLASAPAAQAE